MSASRYARNIEGVVEAFFDGNPRTVGNVFTDGKTIWSYGEHFPMAHWIRFNEILLYNGDSYSTTTSSHQKAVRWQMFSHAPAPYQVVDVPSDVLSSCIRASGRWNILLELPSTGVSPSPYQSVWWWECLEIKLEQSGFKRDDPVFEDLYALRIRLNERMLIKTVT